MKDSDVSDLNSTRNPGGDDETGGDPPMDDHPNELHHRRRHSPWFVPESCNSSRSTKTWIQQSRSSKTHLTNPKSSAFVRSDSFLKRSNSSTLTDPSTISPKPNVFSSLLHTCTKSFSFFSGIQVHSYIVKSGLDSDRFVGNSLLSLYFKLCPDFRDTRKVFDGLRYTDSISWTSMVSGYVRVGMPEESLKVFGEMLDSDVEPNEYTLSAAIKACSDCGDLRLGRCLHGMALRLGFRSNHVISCALTDMYGRNFDLYDALKVFNEMLVPDEIGWTSIISAFARHDRFDEALSLFYSMQMKHGLVPDGFTFGTILTALGNLRRVRQGKEVHSKILTSGICGNVVVESSLVDMYAKCGLVRESRKVFDMMSVKNAVSWCALLGRYCQNSEYENVLQLFQVMDKEDDGYSFGTVLRACAGLSDARQGKQVHGQFLRKGCTKHMIVECALVDLYAKCDLVDYAYRAFSKMEVRNLITWNAMICGFAKNGQGAETVKIFNDMLKEGDLEPDYISFIEVLFACSHSCFVKKGKKHFMSMTDDYGIQPGIVHYNCLVDLLGRAELLEEAENLINSAPFKDNCSLWATLLGACTTYSDPFVAERVAKKVIELDPDYHLSYVLLANIYKVLDRWDDASEVCRMMKSRGLRKSPGKSWIGIKTNISFYLG